MIALSMLCMLHHTAMGIQIGDKAGPANLLTLEDHPLVMDNYGDRTGTVVLFLSGRCPATEAAIARINEIHVRYRLRGVLFVGVCSNPAEDGEELRTFCQRRGVIFPVYRDPSGKTAKQFGARLTPECFLLDKQATLIYHGAVDDLKKDGGLEQAIQDLLAGRAVAKTEVAPTGTPISQPGPKRELDDPYGSFWFSSELIFEKAPGAVAHHCSTITEAANGDLLCVWYGGSYESAEDQVLFIARRRKGQRAWTDPAVLVRNPGQPPGNSVVFRDGLGRIWVVYGRMESRRPIRRGSGWGECRLLYRISEDHGVTWGGDQEISGSFGSLPRNAPITLQSGALALPLTGHVEGTRGSFLLKTSDNGATWERSGVIAGGSQPTIVQRSDGSLLAFMRREPRIVRSESHDEGRTWTPPEKTDFKNPDAGIAMTRLANGHLLLVFNDTETERTPLSIARSVDEGATWEEPLKLEANPGEYSYPCIIQSSDGRIHVTYTYRRYSIKHVEMDEAWLTHLERPN